MSVCSKRLDFAFLALVDVSNASPTFFPGTPGDKYRAGPPSRVPRSVTRVVVRRRRLAMRRVTSHSPSCLIMQPKATMWALLLAAASLTAQSQNADLSKCPATVSAEFATQYTALMAVCRTDVGAADDASAPANANFCTTASCQSVLAYAKTITCKPNGTEPVPTKLCDSSCKASIAEMANYRTGCAKATADSTGLCNLCTKYRQNVDTFALACGLWDSGTTLRGQKDVNPAVCGQATVAPTPAPTEASSNTTWIIVGAIGGVIVLGALAFFCLKKKTGTGKQHDYRSGNSINSGGSRSDGYNSNGTRSNPLAAVTMQNDIRFDTELAQFRIPQQEIQNISLLVKGGYGVVFHATFGKMDVAMKQLLPSKAKDPNAIQDFMNEIRLCARLEHPKIVKFVGISWSTLQDLAVLSEFMSNGDVTGLIRKERKKPEGQRLLHWLPTPHFGATKTSIAADVVDALVYLH
ncbi:hypothetical protein As57867_017033, partial [Aphanomyces stellatus]